MITSKLSKDGLLILLFHGVIRQNNHGVRNYIRKHIEQDYFLEILEKLKVNGTCLSMDEVIEYHESGKNYPANTFAITFDDGFENNASVAAPILESLGLPATFYLTTEFVESGTMSWTDKSERALEHTEKTELTFPWNGNRHSLTSIKGKIQVMEHLRRHVFDDLYGSPSALLEWLFDALDYADEGGVKNPLDEKLSWSQVKQMNSNSLFTFGGHTHTHAIMSTLSAEGLSYEIDTSLGLLKERAGIKSKHFAYPQGLDQHYSLSVIQALKERGVSCCPTAIDGINTSQTGLFDLRRCMVV